mgnify:CR=1 FL=1
MGILRNFIKNIGIKGACIPAKPFDGVCEIALGTAVDTISEKGENNPFELDLSNVKFDSKHIRKLDYSKYRESPLHKKWEREFRLRNEQIKLQAGLSEKY